MKTIELVCQLYGEKIQSKRDVKVIGGLENKVGVRNLLLGVWTESRGSVVSVLGVWTGKKMLGFITSVSTNSDDQIKKLHVLGLD